MKLLGLFGLGRKAGETLAPGRGWTFDIVGEGAYQENLSIICRGKTPDGHRLDCLASLVLERGNPHDSNAVRVEIDGSTVGYLSRSDAAEYRRHVTAPSASCEARVVGGWDRGGRDAGSFGVKLKLRWPPQVLPGSRGRR